MASAVFFMDHKGKVLISRNYRGDVPMSVSEIFQKHIMEDDEDQVLARPRAARTRAGMGGVQMD